MTGVPHAGQEESTLPVSPASAALRLECLHHRRERRHDGREHADGMAWVLAEHPADQGSPLGHPKRHLRLLQSVLLEVTPHEQPAGIVPARRLIPRLRTAIDRRP